MAERRCGFMELHNYAVEHEFGYAETRRQLEAVNTAARRAPLSSEVHIPVVAHIVLSGNLQDVTDEQVHAQIEALNRDFSSSNGDLSQTPTVFQPLVGSCKIRFALAKRDPSGRSTTGINRVRTGIVRFPRASVPQNADSTPYIDRELKTALDGAVAWPREHYLNLWVCNMGKDPLGYAAFTGSAAWRDGVVIDYRCFGMGGTAQPPFDLGRTAVHEVGHWFDLLHIWGDDGGLCSRSDNVGDTPNQGGSNYDVPTFPNISCNNAPNGDLFMNYMDYVDDSAMVMFSQGQVARMHAALQGARSSLLSSRGLQDPDLAERSHLRRLAELASEKAASPAQMVFDGVSWVPVEEQVV